MLYSFLRFFFVILFSGSIGAAAAQPCKGATCPHPGPYFSADYLYWRFEQEQLCFVGVGSRNLADFEQIITLKGQNFGCSSGFRVGVGYDLPYEHYDVFFDWTRFRVNQKKSYSAPEGETVIAIDLIGQTNVGDIAQAQSAEAKWHLRFDVFDLELASTALVGKRLTMRPMMGLKGGWVDQSQHVLYTGVPVDTPADLKNCTATLKNDFKGLGPLGGIDMRWGIGSQFGFFSTISGSLLYGHFEAKTAFSIPSETQSVQLKFINSRNGTVPVFQILVGTDWKYCLYDKWVVYLGVAYEMQQWWNLFRANNNLVSDLYVNYRGGGDLSTHGLTARARFDF